MKLKREPHTGALQWWCSQRREAACAIIHPVNQAAPAEPTAPGRRPPEAAQSDDDDEDWHPNGIDESSPTTISDLVSDPEDSDEELVAQLEQMRQQGQQPEHFRMARRVP